MEEQPAVVNAAPDSPKTPVQVEPAAAAVESEDDVDPLDAYMQEVNREMRRVNHFISPAKAKGVVILTGVAKKKTTAVKKGELIEQNMDSLEYSSEDELEDIRDTAVNLAMKHRKELAKIDHSSVSYAPFRKNFYVEVPELARMTSSEVEKYRSELEGIQVKGKGCPKPIKVSGHKSINSAVNVMSFRLPHRRGRNAASAKRRWTCCASWASRNLRPYSARRYRR